jgi:hypothetical protein
MRPVSIATTALARSGLYSSARLAVGFSAGVFWSVEAAIALAYLELKHQGRFLGFWLSFRVGGQIIGGAINLGLNATNDKAGKVSYSVFQAFIALQAISPLAALLLSRPHKVQRTGMLESESSKSIRTANFHVASVPVRLAITNSTWDELKDSARLFLRRDFLLIAPLIAQAVYAEAVMFTFQPLWFSVRARALESFLSDIVAIISGNLLGYYLDYRKISLKTRSRGAFFCIITLQGAP